MKCLDRLSFSWIIKELRQNCYDDHYSGTPFQGFWVTEKAFPLSLSVLLGKYLILFTVSCRKRTVINLVTQKKKKCLASKDSVDNYKSLF